VSECTGGTVTCTDTTNTCTPSNYCGTITSTTNNTCDGPEVACSDSTNTCNPGGCGTIYSSQDYGSATCPSGYTGPTYTYNGNGIFGYWCTQIVTTNTAIKTCTETYGAGSVNSAQPCTSCYAVVNGTNTFIGCCEVGTSGVYQGCKGLTTGTVYNYASPTYPITYYRTQKTTQTSYTRSAPSLYTYPVYVRRSATNLTTYTRSQSSNATTYTRTSPSNNAVTTYTRTSPSNVTTYTRTSPSNVTSTTYTRTSPSNVTTITYTRTSPSNVTTTNYTRSSATNVTNTTYTRTSASNLTTTTYGYNLRLIKSVGGTVSTATGDISLTSAAVAIKVTTSGNDIVAQAYSDTGLTITLGSAISYTATSPVKGTAHGIIKAPSAYGQGSTVDNFSITI
jgi:hypothetical protein